MLLRSQSFSKIISSMCLKSLNASSPICLILPEILNLLILDSFLNLEMLFDSIVSPIFLIIVSNSNCSLLS
ncbi:Uncharacterised protein [Chlamydia abortus]|nr:Uncharacterised protein [Chlamydia abortus]